MLTQGVYQREIDEGVKLWLTCEPGIGYRGSYARFRAFESAYLQNFMAGSEHPRESIDGDWYSRVIPNYFEFNDFPFKAEKEDWFFYIGRMIHRKGLHIAIETTRALGAELVLAGQGDYDLPDHCRHVGYVEPQQRAELMGSARAVFIPTLYMEAFGGTNVEAQLCGTGAITTDFACFRETVLHGITGFRCNTLQDFVEAARNVDKLDPWIIRERAERFLTTNVRWEFQKWFDDLFALYESAHIEGVKAWSRVDG